MRVKVKQAHRAITPGGYREFAAGEEIEIPEDEFCGNLHEKIEEKTEGEENGTRIKKRRPSSPEPV